MVLDLGLALVILSQSEQSQNIETVLRRENQLDNNRRIVLIVDFPEDPSSKLLEEIKNQYALRAEDVEINHPSWSYSKREDVRFLRNSMKYHVRDNRQYLRTKIPHIAHTARHSKYNKINVIYKN